METRNDNNSNNTLNLHSARTLTGESDPFQYILKDLEKLNLKQPTGERNIVNAKLTFSIIAGLLKSVKRWYDDTGPSLAQLEILEELSLNPKFKDGENRKIFSELYSNILNELTTSRIVKSLQLFKNLPIHEFVHIHDYEKDKKTRPFYQKIVDDFNLLSYTVSLDVLQKKTLTSALLAIRHWVLLANKCAKEGDFHSLMSIMTTLNSKHISRLMGKQENETCDLTLITKAYFNSLLTLIDEKQNYFMLREEQKKHEVFIPYLGLLNRQLTFLIIGNTKNEQSEDNENTQKKTFWQKIFKRKKIIKQNITSIEVVERKSKKPLELLQEITFDNSDSITPKLENSVIDGKALTISEKSCLNTIINLIIPLIDLQNKMNGIREWYNFELRDPWDTIFLHTKNCLEVKLKTNFEEMNSDVFAYFIYDLSSKLKKNINLRIVGIEKQLTPADLIIPFTISIQSYLENPKSDSKIAKPGEMLKIFSGSFYKLKIQTTSHYNYKPVTLKVTLNETQVELKKNKPNTQRKSLELASCRQLDQENNLSKVRSGQQIYVRPHDIGELEGWLKFRLLNEIQKTLNLKKHWSSEDFLAIKKNDLTLVAELKLFNRKEKESKPSKKEFKSEYRPRTKTTF